MLDFNKRLKLLAYQAVTAHKLYFSVTKQFPAKTITEQKNPKTKQKNNTKKKGEKKKKGRERFSKWRLV